MKTVAVMLAVAILVSFGTVAFTQMETQYRVLCVERLSPDEVEIFVYLPHPDVNLSHLILDIDVPIDIEWHKQVEGKPEQCYFHLESLYFTLQAQSIIECSVTLYNNSTKVILLQEQIQIPPQYL